MPRTEVRPHHVEVDRRLGLNLLLVDDAERGRFSAEVHGGADVEVVDNL